MAEIVNLRLVRKRKARDAAADAAAEARAKHGRTKAEKSLDRARSEKAGRDVEAHRLTGPEAAPSTCPVTGPAAGPATEQASERATGPAAAPVILPAQDAGVAKPD